MSFGGPIEVGSIKATVGLDTADLKRGLDQARQALSESARMTQDALRFTNELAKGIDKEADAGRRSTAVKQQQAAAERELATLKSQLNALLAGESAAAQQVAAKYSLLDTAQRRNLVTIKEQITAQRALQEAEIASAVAAEKAATAEIAATERAAAAAAKASASQLATAQKNVGRNLGTIGRGLSSATLPIVAFEGAAALAGNDVQGAEASIRAQTGAQGARLASLDQSLKNVAATVPQSMKVVGDAIGAVAARTGFTGKALDDLTRTELRFAQITNEAPLPLIKAMSQAFTAWGITGAQMIPTLNLLNRAHEATGIGVTKLATEAARLAPTFKNFGFGLTDSVALLSAFEKANIPAQRMVQGLNQALARLAKEGVTNAHQALEIMIQRIEHAKNPMSAIAEATKLFGARVGPELVDRIRSGQLSIEALEKVLAHNTDTIDKAAAQTRTFAVSFGEFRNQVEIALAPLGIIILRAAAQALDGMKPLIEGVKEAILWFSKLSPGAQEGILGVVAAVALLGPAVVKVAGFITAITEMKTALLELRLAGMALAGGTAAAGAVGAGGGILGAIGVGIGALTSPIGLAIAAVALLAVAWETNFLHIQDVTKRVAHNVSTYVQHLADQSASGSTRPGGIFTGGGGADAYMMAGMAAARAAPRVAGPPLPPGYVRPQDDYVRIRNGVGAHYSGQAEFMLDQANDKAYLGTMGQGGIGDGNVGKRPKWLEDMMKQGKKLTPLQQEQKQYTEMLAQAHERLKEELAGEDNVTAKLQAHFHLLHLTSKDDLVVTEQRIRAHEKAQALAKSYADALGGLQQKIRDLKEFGSEDKGLPKDFKNWSPAKQKNYRETSDYTNWLQERSDASEAVVQQEKQALQAIHKGNADWEREMEAAARLQKYNPAMAGKGYPDVAARLPTVPNLVQLSNESFGKPFAGLTMTEQHEVYQSQQQKAYKETAKQGEEIFKRGAEERIKAGSAAYEKEKTDYNALAAVKQKADQEERKRKDTLAAAAIKDFQNQTVAWSRQHDQIVKQLNQMAQQTQGFFQGMFQDLTEHGFKGFFGRTLDAFSKMLQQMSAAYLASGLTDLLLGKKDATSGERGGGGLGSILGAVLGAFGGGGGGGAGIGAAGDVAAAGLSGGAASALTGALPAFASGGSYSGGPMWVGEHGKELIFPHGGGTVMPHAQSMAMAGGTHTTVHMTVVTQDAQSFQAPQNRHAITESLARELQRAQARRR